MARKPDYGFQKRNKELERKKKQDAKQLQRGEDALRRAAEKARAADEPVAEKE